MALCVISLLVGGISGCISGATITKTTTTESIGTTTTSALSSNGLQLRVSVNMTSLTPGEALQVSVSGYNTLATNNNVAAEKNWGGRWTHPRGLPECLCATIRSGCVSGSLYRSECFAG